MPTKTIYVSKKGNSGNLKLRDSEGHNPNNDDLTTNVGSGDTVKWEKDPDASSPNSIDSIVSVTYSPPQAGPPPIYQNSVKILYHIDKDGNHVFDGNAAVADGVATAYVQNGTAANAIENYNIGYKEVEGGQTKYDDPRLRMT